MVRGLNVKASGSIETICCRVTPAYHHLQSSGLFAGFEFGHMQRAYVLPKDAPISTGQYLAHTMLPYA